MAAVTANLSDEAIEHFNRSLERVQEDKTFIERFYGHFMANPEAASFFANTDMRHQRHRLGASLYTALLVAPSVSRDEAELRRLAKMHGPQGMNIPTHLYDEWLDCLVQAAAECDPRWAPQLEQLWRRVAGRGVELMLSYGSQQNANGRNVTGARRSSRS